MAFEAEIIECAEKNWNRLTSPDANPITGERFLVRGLKVSATRKASVGRYLATVKTVTNPLADSSQQQGETTEVWDVVGLSWNGQYEGYIQSLRLVAAQSDVTGSASGWHDGVSGNGVTVAEEPKEVKR
jgi:hypothetical protein